MRKGEDGKSNGNVYLLVFILFVLIGVTAVVRPGPAEIPDSGLDGITDLTAYPWVYLRGGRPLAADETVIELIAVGDVMLGRGVANQPRPFAGVEPWLPAADLVLGNLESVIGEGGVPRSAPFDGGSHPYLLQAPPTAVSVLRRAGFDVLGLANNHALDFGPAALAETVARLQEAGMTAVGAGIGEANARRPLVREVNGIRVAFLAFSDVVDPVANVVVPQKPATTGIAAMEEVGTANRWVRATWDEAATAAVARAQAQADAVVVSMHWGYEYELRPDPAQEKVAQALLAAGADLVVGHHPHVVQALRAGDGHLIAYSLGNFVFDQGQGETGQGLVLRAFFDEQGLRAVQALPVWAGLRPRLMTPEEAAPLLARVRPPPPRVGFTCQDGSCDPVEVPQTAAGGAFWAGAIDLTGDGVPEKVRRHGERVAIYGHGTAVWQSPPPWRVVDVALGDADDDGRGEVMLALWQPDPDGIERSQPYLVGYRGGQYQLMWGGRPVVDPIQEIELGDVDGDGVVELVVLEERHDEPGRAVTVWRWHGWGFSLIWRSPIGRYHDLVLLPHEGDGSVTISVARESEG